MKGVSTTDHPQMAGRAVLYGLTLVLALLAMAGGCRDWIAFPAAADIHGIWRAEGKSHKDTRTYSGIYEFLPAGRHGYDIVLNDGTAKKGSGEWSYEEGSGTLRVTNDTGSIYVGTFSRGKPGTVGLFTINNQWGVTLEQQTKAPLSQPASQ